MSTDRGLRGRNRSDETDPAAPIERDSIVEETVDTRRPSVPQPAEVYVGSYMTDAQLVAAATYRGQTIHTDSDGNEWVGGTYTPATESHRWSDGPAVTRWAEHRGDPMKKRPSMPLLIQMEITGNLFRALLWTLAAGAMTLARQPERHEANDRAAWHQREADRLDADWKALVDSHYTEDPT